jgi:selenocysteine-specific elongation factor
VERHFVVGTAGHIDHGKTALVKALTGVDTDRLAEEKARGITIDLGFAPLALGELSASIVDVPGHEGFIRNMVAGATGVDVALLVVAADEGVMPQTREHLDILRFLGVSRGVVALTKCDLAPEAEWRALVAEETGSEVRERFGVSWPLVEVSAATGAGLERLRDALRDAGLGLAARAAKDRFRMPVDRVFSLPGAGTIVTGTVWSGSAHEGDHLTVLPAGKSARVRSIQVHGRAASEAGPGRRAALALVGVDHADAPRGSVVVSGGGWRASRVLDTEITLVEGAGLKPRQRVRVHHGTAEVMARVARLTSDGGTLTARFSLEAALVARAGDRFVVRSYSPLSTLGGGVVTDPWADDRAMRRSGAAAPSGALSDGERVGALVRRRGASGLAQEELEVLAGLDVTRLTAVLASASEIGLVQAEGRWFAHGQVDAAAAALVEALDRFHAQHPLEPGMPAQAWRAAALAAHPALVGLAEQLSFGRGRVEREGSLVRLKGWVAGAGAAARELQSAILAALEKAGPEPPTVGELASRFEGQDVAAALRLLARQGTVIAVGPDRYYAAAALDLERRRLVSVLEEVGAATPAALRDRLGRSRKWLIPLLEWADREGVTVRQGDQRRLASKGGA